MIQNRGILVFVCFIGIQFAIGQQYETQRVTSITVNEGMSGNIIYDILQDKLGFIWIATEQGLNKYDGKNFTHFSTTSNRYPLTHNRTQTLLSMPNGNIWIGTSNGLNIYDYQSDSIIQVTTSSAPLQLIYNDITTLAQGQDENIVWIGTYGDGIHYFNRQTQTFETFKLPEPANATEPLRIMSLLEDDLGRLWIGTQLNGLYCYHPKTKTIRHHPLTESSCFIRDMYQDTYKRIWIGSSKGCYWFNETTGKPEPVTYPPEISNHSTGAIIEDGHGRIWIGTEFNVVHFSSRVFSTTEKFDYQLADYGEFNPGIHCPSVNSIYADQDHNIWIGTAWGGVNMIKGRDAKFLLLRHNPHKQNTLPNSPIISIHTNNNHTLYCATLGTGPTGLCYVDLQTGKVYEHPLNKKLPNYIYQSIYLDGSKDLWVGTYSQGLLKTGVNSGDYTQFKHDPLDEKSLPGNDIRVLYKDSDNILWIGTQKGLANYDEATGEISRVPFFCEGNISVRTIHEDESGALWIGTYGDGAMRFHPGTDSIDDGLAQRVPAIIHDMIVEDTVVWLASNDQGLLRYHRTKDTISGYSEKEGLENNYTHSLLKDPMGKIWVGHDKGLSKLDPVTDEIVNFTAVDGLQPSVFSDRSAVALPNGSMVFAGFGGINLFDPLKVNKNDELPEVVFTKLLVSNELVKPSAADNKSTVIREHISLTDHITIHPHQRVFTIEFMGIDYNANPKIQYAYMLEGADDEWIHTGNHNNITFRDLQPGEYVLKVKASSPDGVWSDSNMASLGISVQPPFRSTLWAYAIYTIVILALIYFVGSFIVLRIRSANNLKIERAHREKDTELHQAKLQFFTNISHELRTPLTLILGPLQSLHSAENNSKKKETFDLIIYNAKRLLTMVNQLLDFRKAERSQMRLKVQHSDIVQTINYVVLSFKELKKQKDIELLFPQREEVMMAWHDREIISKSLVNLISNSFKYTPAGGTIEVMIVPSEDHTNNQHLSIKVTDTGKGIQPADLPHIFDRFYQGDEDKSQAFGTGIGLHLVKSLVELHHGTIDVESTPHEQTTISLSIPTHKNAYEAHELYDDNELPDHLDSGVPGLIHMPEADTYKQTGDNKTDKRKKVLVVEDHADIRQYIKNILGPDYAIEEAENGQRGIELVTASDFDLVITDIMMPVMDGMTFCKKIKSSVETDHIPVIIITAKTEIENRIEGIDAGADAYISKPFHPEHVKVLVNKLIESREKLKERYGKKLAFGEEAHTTNEVGSTEEKFLQQAMAVVAERMTESEFSGNQLADELYISRMGLHRKIKALTGETTNAFIRNLRLKKAYDLLSIEGKNVSEVCYEVGFSSPSYFTTCFREIYHMTPSEYVQSVREKKNNG